VTLSNPSNANLGINTVHTYTINDNDSYPSVQFDLTSSGGGEAVTPANLGVSLSASYVETVTVDYSVTGGTATGGGVDYTLAAGTLTFDPGVTTDSVSIAVVDDGLVESSETVEVTLASPSNATLGANTVHTYTINDNDVYPSVEFDLSNSSGDESVTPANLAVSLSAAYVETVTVDYSITGGTATGGGVDYILAAGTLTFDPGVTTGNVSIGVVNDGLVEADETIEVTLTGPSKATLGVNTVHTYTINDNDVYPTVQFDSSSSAGNEAITPADLGVSLSASYVETVTVDYSVTGGTATGGGVDYTLAAGTLTFDPGVTADNVSISVVDDGLVEGDETVEVTLSNPSNASLGVNTVHTYTINNDDSYPSVEFDLAGSSGSEVASPVDLDVSLSAAYVETVTVDYSVTGGTATGGGVDYTLAAGTLTFDPGVTADAVSIAVVDDGLVEADETVEVALSNPSNATLGLTDVHTYTILDNDIYPTVEFDLTASSGDEAVSPANLGVSLSGSYVETATVDYSVTGGTATGGGVDYTLAAGTLTFDPGVTTTTTRHWARWYCRTA
jgi:hypothetical protein